MRQPSTVTGYTDNVVLFEALKYMICQKKIIYPYIVMDKHQNIVRTRRVYSTVVYLCNANLVFESDECFKRTSNDRRLRDIPRGECFQKDCSL